MRRIVGVLLLAAGVVVAALAVWAVVAPGGSEAAALRISGLFYFAVGMLLALAGGAIILSRR